MKRSIAGLAFVAAILFAVRAEAQTVSVGSASARCGESVAIPVSIDSVNGLLAAEVRISYDTSRLTVTNVTSGSLTAGFSISYNVVGGVLRVAMASGTAVSGGGTLASVTFSASANATGDVALSISNVLVNDVSRPGNSGTVTLSCPQPPGAPQLVSPANGASGVATPVTLTWNAAANASGYLVSFGTSSPPPAYTASTGTSASVPANDGTTYYWSVRATGEGGSADSAIFSFTTAGTACSTPAMPQQVSVPPEVASGNAFEVTWGAVAGATDYLVEEATEATFAGATVTSVAATRLSLTRTVTSSSTRWFRVRARNAAAPCNNEGPASAAVSTRIVPAPALAAGTEVFPIVGSTDGAFGSRWRTSLQLHNPTSQRISGRLVYHAHGTAGTSSDPFLAYSLGAGETISYPDLSSALRVSAGLGSLDLVPDGAALPLSIAHVYNDAGAAGTTGLMLDSLGVGEALQAGQRGTLIAPMMPGSARLNVGIRTLQAGATLAITIRDRSGASIDSQIRNYPATYFVQMPLGSLSSVTLRGDETVTFEVQQGAAIVYGSITDNASQDPSLQIARPL